MTLTRIRCRRRPGASKFFRAHRRLWLCRLSSHPVWLEKPAPTHALHLLSNQPKTRLHSQYDHGSYSRSSKIQAREPLTLNPLDARARGLVDGDVVKVFNERGAFLAGVIVSDGIRPGVVQIATGAWFDPLVHGERGSLENTATRM